MRTRVLLVCAAALLGGCGYVGDPLPPALNIPTAVKDLRVTQRADRIVIEFTAPALTTEELGIREFGEVDVRVGIVPAQFTMETWAARAKPVPAKAEPGKPVRVEASVGDWAGKEVLVAVRTVNVKGRHSEWSNAVTVPVRKPLPAPSGLAAASHPEGVRLSWQQVEGGTAYRVYKAVAGQEEPAVAGTVEAVEFIDRSAGLGRPLTYSVQALAGTAESEPSAAVTVVPRDEFAPGVPSGLTAVAGVGSIELTWTRNTEADLKGYRVYRATGAGDFTILADAVQGPAYSDRQTASGTMYRYAVTSVDQAGNESGRSNALEVTAP